MDLVKKNILSIVCGVIALVGFSAWFWLVKPAANAQQEELDERVKVANAIKSVATKTRTLPTGETLPIFPNPEVIKAADEMVKNVSVESRGLLDQATRLNRYDLLVEDALPTPRGGTEQFQFRERYHQLYVQPQRIQREILQAGSPPTPDDIRRAEEVLWREGYVGRIISQDNAQTNEAALKIEYDAEKVKIPLEERQRVAIENKIYVDQNALKLHPDLVIATGAPPEPRTMWYAQLGIWIQEALASAIADANKDATNVLDAPVKHLVRIDFQDVPYFPAPRQLAASGSGGGGAPAMGQWGNTGTNGSQPTGPEFSPTSPVPFKPAASLTGRVSNSLYDVTYFTMTVRVDGRHMTTLLNELGRSRLIYVRNLTVNPVNPILAQRDGYFYGADPVVELVIEGEMLFLRSWTVGNKEDGAVKDGGIMPLPVRQELGIAPPPQPTFN